MSFRNASNVSNNSIDDFHNCKDSTSEADYTAESFEDKKDKRKDAKKFLFKKDSSKDKGYTAFTSEHNQDSIFLVNSKSKKSKPDNKITSLNVFKKSFKDDKRSKDDTKRNKKTAKERTTFYDKEATRENLFGNYLENAVASFACNDGVRIPAPIRICIDLIELKGIDSEHIYRRHVNKSLLESICESINRGHLESRMEELNADPNLACYVVKRFLRELKMPLINDETLTLFDKCDSSISDKELTLKIGHLKLIINKLAIANRDTFAYLVMHFHRMLRRSETNKIEPSLFVQKFHPMFRIRDRLFKFIIIYADELFSELRFKKYRTKASNEETVSRFSILPESIEDLEQEISKQENYLSKLHTKIANEEHSTDKTVQESLCDELWTLQRYVTSLKRKVKKLKLEKKALEAEQMSMVKEAQQSNADENKTETSTSSTDINLPLDQLYNKELNIVCENLVLINSIQNLLERMNREKLLIAELQQKFFNHIGNGTNVQITYALPDMANLDLQELVESEQMIINENKLLEERINLINKRINSEKEKIFELKYNIQMKTLGPPDFSLSTSNLNGSSSKTSTSTTSTTTTPLVTNKKPIELSLSAKKINLQGEKSADLIMTKL